MASTTQPPWPESRKAAEAAEAKHVVKAKQLPGCGGHGGR
jgi:hypothetical protein